MEGISKMAVEKKLTQRDETLIKVLDRLSDDIKKQQLLLDDVAKLQLELLAEIERSGLRQHARIDLTDAAIDKTQETFVRYRSDMLHLVNEQDRLNDISAEISKKQAAIAFSQDNIVNILTDISNRLETQGKDLRELSAHSAKQGETLSREISGTNRDLTKLHMDTEKRLIDAQREVKREQEKTRIDIERRLLTLDKIESSLEVLLIRTEPPEKKPFFAVRVIRNLRIRIKNARIRRRR